jgi:hypothetical protein
VTAMPGRTIARNSSRANALSRLSRQETLVERSLHATLHEPRHRQTARPGGNTRRSWLRTSTSRYPRGQPRGLALFRNHVPGAYSRPWTVARKGYGEATPERCIRSFQCRFPYMINST